jgi:hypothetical protein
MKIGIATCYNIPEPDIDEAIVIEAFERRGHETHLVAWDEPAIDWSDFDCIIVRSTWNYPDYSEQFADWIGRVSELTTLLNPGTILLANLEKSYLVDIAERGVNVVPTKWINTSEAESLEKLLTSKSVIKPAIGAGSMDTQFFEVNELKDATTWLRSMGPNRMFMVQPYFESINTVGEQSIICIGPEPSHRIVKHPRFAGQEESVDGPFDCGEFEALAREVIEPVKDQILYARVDLMMDDEGVWRLSELELIEPSLFFSLKPGALDLLIDRAELMLS